MSDWKTYKLGEVFTFSSGLSKAREYFGSGYDFVAFKDIFANIFLPEKLSSLVQSNEIERKSCSVLRGDVFLTRTSETYNELGISSVALNDYPNATFNGFTKRLRPNGNIIIVPEYAGYYFRSPKFRSLVTQYSSITTRASLNNEILSNLTIDIPIVALQTEIGKILKSLDDKIELNLQMNQTLEAMAQAIFKEWFVNFNFPKSLNRDSYDLYDDNDAENHNNQTNQKNHSADNLVDGLPKGWRMGKVKDIYKTTSGGTPSRTKEEYYKNGTINWVKSKELNGNFIFDTEEKITEEALKNSSTKLIPRHSILLAMYGATVGEYAITSKETTCNQAICAIIANEEFPFTYFFEYFKINRNEIIGRASGSAQQNISQALIQQLDILIPPIEVVKKYHSVVESNFIKMENNLLQIQSLIQIRDSLLPKLMTGKIEIKE